MTHKLSQLLALVLFCLLTPITAFAYDFSAVNEDGVTIYYNKLSDTECEVTRSYSNSDVKYSGAITIPASVTYNGATYTVTAIGRSAFDDCFLTSIILPNSIISIGEAAFILCSYLTNIEIPNSVTTIGQDAFRDCTSLTSITIPNSVSSIGDWAFVYCM